MKFSYDLYGGPASIKELPVIGATMNKGALVIAGPTTGTNFGIAKLAAMPFTDAIGIMEEPILSTQVPSVQSTGVTLLHKVIVNPFAVYRCEYSQAVADTLTGATSATTVYSLTSIEDLTGGWVYVISGQAKGQLQYIVSQSSGVLNTLTAFSPVVATGDYVLKIGKQFDKLRDLNATMDLFGGAGQSGAAAGTGIITILDTYIQADTIPLTKLRPDLHSGLTGLDTKNPKFFADVMFTKHLLTHQS